MKKIADGYYEFEETVYPSSEVELKMRVALIDGREQDTDVELEGRFVVAGCFRREFAKKLGDLIDQYRI